MNDLDNILDFEKALKKKNRINKQKSSSKKKSTQDDVSDPWFTSHAIEQIEDRKIDMNRVLHCLREGRKEEKNGAMHFVFDNLRVVLDRDEVTVLTAYYSSDIFEDAAA